MKSNDLFKSVKDPWEAEFIKKFTIEETVDLMHACNYLEMIPLFELCCASIASEFKGMNFDRIKQRFGMESVNISAEEEETL